MSITVWAITIVVLAAGAYMGWLGPTGLAGRTREKKEKDRQQDVAATWLKRDAERIDGPH